MGTSENQATRVAYTEVESNDSLKIALRCHCGHVIKKRRDTLTPGLHQVICLACSNTSSEVKLMSGEVRTKTAADHRTAA